MSRWSPLLCLTLAVLAQPLSALASAQFELLQGDVYVAMGAQKPQPAKAEERVMPGSTVLTGRTGKAVLRFEDDQRVMLAPDSEFKIVDFRYPQSQPKADRAEFELRKGALRLVDGAMARRSPAAFTLRTPQTVLGVSGTEFMVVIDYQTWLSVLSGSVTARINAGASTFGPGAYARMPSIDEAPVPINAAGVPSAVHSEFYGVRSLGAAGGQASGAEPASGQAAAWASPGRIAIIGAAVAAVAIGASHNHSTTSH